MIGNYGFVVNLSKVKNNEFTSLQNAVNCDDLTCNFSFDVIDDLLKWNSFLKAEKMEKVEMILKELKKRELFDFRNEEIRSKCCERVLKKVNKVFLKLRNCGTNSRRRDEIKKKGITICFKKEEIVQVGYESIDTFEKIPGNPEKQVGLRTLQRRKKIALSNISLLFNNISSVACVDSFRFIDNFRVKNENGELIVSDLVMKGEALSKKGHESLNVEEKLSEIIAALDYGKVAISKHIIMQKIMGERQLKNELYQEKQSQFEQSGMELHGIFVEKKNLLKLIEKGSDIAGSKTHFRNQISLADNLDNLTFEANLILDKENDESIDFIKKKISSLSAASINKLCSLRNLPRGTKAINISTLSEFIKKRIDEKDSLLEDAKVYNCDMGNVEGFVQIGSFFYVADFVDFLYRSFNNSQKINKGSNETKFSSPVFKLDDTTDNEIWTKIAADGTLLNKFNVNVVVSLLNVIHKPQSASNNFVVATIDTPETIRMMKEVFEMLNVSKWMKEYESTTGEICVLRKGIRKILKNVKRRVFITGDYGFILKMAGVKGFDLECVREDSNEKNIEQLMNCLYKNSSELNEDEEKVLKSKLEESCTLLKGKDERSCIFCSDVNWGEDCFSMEMLDRVFETIPFAIKDMKVSQLIPEVLHLIKNSGNTILQKMFQWCIRKVNCKVADQFAEHVSKCAKTFSWLPKVTDAGKGNVEYPILTCKSFLEIVKVFPDVCNFFHAYEYEVVCQKTNKRNKTPFFSIGEHFSFICKTAHVVSKSDKYTIDKYEFACKEMNFLYSNVLAPRATPSIHIFFQHSFVYLRKWGHLGLFSTEGFESCNQEFEDVNDLCGGSFGGCRWNQRLKYEARKLVQIGRGMRPDIVDTFSKETKRTKVNKQNVEVETTTSGNLMVDESPNTTNTVLESQNVSRKRKRDERGVLDSNDAMGKRIKSA